MLLQVMAIVYEVSYSCISFQNTQTGARRAWSTDVGPWIQV